MRFNLKEIIANQVGQLISQKVICEDLKIMQIENYNRQL